MLAAPTSIPPPRRTGTRPSGASTRRPSRRSRPTRRVTVCHPPSSTGCASETLSPRDAPPIVVARDVPDDECDWPSVHGAAPPLILYTSGSTGAPKGAVLSQRAVSVGVQSWIDPVMALTPEDVVLGVLPLAHSYGLNGGLL